MFEFFKKYGGKVAHLAHELANVIEDDGPMLVSGLRYVGALIPIAGGPVGAVAGAVEIADAVVTKFVPRAAQPDPRALAAVDARIAAGDFATPAVAPALAPPLNGMVVNSNPLRGPIVTAADVESARLNALAHATPDPVPTE